MEEKARICFNQLFERGIPSLIALVFIMFAALAGDGRAAMTIEQAVKTLDGLSGKERLARVEEGARKEAQVRWASSIPVTPAGTLFPAL